MRPTAVLSYHQAFDVVDITPPAQSGRPGVAWPPGWGSGPASVPCSGPCHGTLTQWVDRTLKTIAITVELDGRVSRAETNRAAAAVLRLGTWLGR